MFLRNCWYVAAWDHELIDGRMLARTLLEDHVLLYRGDSGQVVALHDRCPHRGALLSKGRREGDSVRCMYHGIRYDATGRCNQIPGQDMIPPKLRVRSYPIAERNHLVWIWMGDPALADPAQIVDFPYLSDPQLEGHPGLHSLRRELPADHGQPERLRAPRIRAHEDAGRLRGIRVRHKARGDRTAPARLPCRTLAHEQRSAAVPSQGHTRQDRQGRPAQYRQHARPGHLLHGDDVRTGGLRAPKKATSRAHGSIGTASS